MAVKSDILLRHGRDEMPREDVQFNGALMPLSTWLSLVGRSTIVEDLDGYAFPAGDFDRVLEEYDEYHPDTMLKAMYKVAGDTAEYQYGWSGENEYGKDFPQSKLNVVRVYPRSSKKIVLSLKEWLSAMPTLTLVEYKGGVRMSAFMWLGSSLLEGSVHTTESGSKIKVSNWLNARYYVEGDKATSIDTYWYYSHEGGYTRKRVIEFNQYQFKIVR